MKDRMAYVAKMASLGQLTAGIAHEINNPTACILSNLYTLEEYYRHVHDALRALPAGAAGKDPKLAEILEDIPALIREMNSAAERIARIVKDLRVVAHSDDTSLACGDLHACIDRALAIMTNELKYKVTVIKDYGKVPDMYFREPQMLQVFMNLLFNAVQAIDAKGTVHIMTRSRGKYVHVEIRDSGRGIAPEHAPKVFEPFFTTKPVGEGAGLGLFVAQEIIKKHGGEITVVSEAGEGAVFTVKLLRDGPPGKKAGAEEKG
jgi:two-component system, NtrC family, sensor kinase